ncbi:hypothetical protein JHK85_012397 [Glycine max]|nr:hypothetical protein JHK85_012397 [Glycine max]
MNFQKIKTTVTEDRDALVDAVVDKMERDLILLGATAVEDRLQKGYRFLNVLKALLGKNQVMDINRRQDGNCSQHRVCM